MKRSLSETNFSETDGIYASRRRRVAYTDADAELAQIYENLADDVPAIRIKAAGGLLKYVLSGPRDSNTRLETAVPRLVKGLCSGRKGARLGFSIALSELLRHAFRLAYKENATQFCLGEITDAIVSSTQIDGRASGQDKRDQLIGRRFAFQAVLQSDIAHVAVLSSSEWQHYLQSLLDLALQKQWLRAECGALLYGYLKGPSGERLTTARLQSVIDTLQHVGFFKTPEGVALWLLLSERCSDLLPRSVWQKNDPLSAGERVKLKKLLHGDAVEATADWDSIRIRGKPDSGSRQSMPSFAWTVILNSLYRRKGGADFQGFWNEVVDAGLFADSASDERKSLGLQVLSLAISSASLPLLPHLFSKNVVRCLVNHRADQDRYLYQATNVPIMEILERSRSDPLTTPDLLQTLFMAFGYNFDQLTKTNAIETMVQDVDAAVTAEVVSVICNMIKQSSTKDVKQSAQRLRGYADMLVSLTRTHREASQRYRLDKSGLPTSPGPWLSTLLDVLIEYAYPKHGSPLISMEVQSYYRTKLVSCIGLLLDNEPRTAVLGLHYVVDALQSDHEDIAADLSQRSMEVLKHAYEMRKKVTSLENQSTELVFELLYTPAILAVYDEEPDSIESLHELNESLERVLSGDDDTTGSLVELLLSFVSKPSTTFRKLAACVFTLLAPSLESDSLQSMVDILQTKEGASGQNELFAQHGDDEDDMDSGEANLEGIDVEDMSDVELVNGEEVDASEEEAEDSDAGSESSRNDKEDSADDDESEDAGEEADDEEAIFDRKLAEALGTAGMDEGASDDHGSDMDDEQMMALEPSLASIFKERSKDTSKKQDNKGAKENIINFKNRVLDLLMIFVKSQYSNVTALDLILPLATTTRTSSTKPTRQKAFDVLQTYFQTCVKKHSLPRPEDDEACFAVLSALLEESKLTGSILHADACSRSSLFLSRVLIALDTGNLERIDKMYADLLAENESDPKSNIRESIFTEWSSWKVNSSEHLGKWSSWLQDSEK